MEKFIRLTAKACPLMMPNLNTDQILPARFLKWPRAKGLGSVLFRDLRYDEHDNEHADFPLNQHCYRDAGLEWAESGCSMCVGINGDLVPPGERCASTTNRNFRGRQGPGARTHLMSPAMAAAAAVTGHLADVRLLLAGREI